MFEVAHDVLQSRIGLPVARGRERARCDDVSDARVYGGIHFRFDQDAADKMGEDIGRYDDEHLLLPLGGED